MATLITIERHILDQQRKYPEATGVFSGLLYDIALTAKIIARETTRAGLVNILGSADTANIHDEVQQKRDVFADQTLFGCAITPDGCAASHLKGLKISSPFPTSIHGASTCSCTICWTGHRTST